MKIPTLTSNALRKTGGGFCQLALIRELLHDGETIDILYQKGVWKRIHEIVAEIANEPPPADGTRYIMVDGGDTACRVKPDEAIMCRIAREKKDGKP